MSSATLYPMHQVEIKHDGKSYHPKQFGPCGNGGAMVPLEQTKRAADGSSLFCLRCNDVVLASKKEHRQAWEAAGAEGWTMPAARVTPLTPGDLSEETRRQISGLLAIEREPSDSKGRADAATKGARGAACGLVEGDGLGNLTATGRALALLVVEPEVPTSITAQTHSRNYLASYAKRAKDPKPKKAKAVTPSDPMVCTCAHTVGKHATAHGTGSPCRESGCGCKRYVQQKIAAPEKVKKARKSKTVAA